MSREGGVSPRSGGWSLLVDGKRREVDNNKHFTLEFHESVAQKTMLNREVEYAIISCKTHADADACCMGRSN